VNLVAPATLGPGNYTSTITVTACTSGPDCTSGIIGSPQKVMVDYKINGVTASKASLDYTLSLTPATADYTQTLNVQAYPSVSVASDVDWLTITPNSATTSSTPFEVRLVQPAVDTFDSGPHTATLTLTGVSGLMLKVPVTLTIAKPQMDQVTPYVAMSNAPVSAVLRGKYFDLLPANSIDLSLTANGTSIAPADLAIVGPTEAHLTHPALPAGTYFVRMHDAQGAIIDRSAAQLVVVDPTTYPSEVIPYPATGAHGIRSVIYDPERKALLLVAAASRFEDFELLRYEYTATGWTSTSVPFPYLDRIALTANGRDLMAVSSPTFGSAEQARISLHSPTTLAERSALQTSVLYSYFPGIGMLSDGDVLLMEDSRTTTGPGRPLYRYSLKKNTFVSMHTSSYSSGFDRGVLVVSGDGQRAIAGENGGGSTPATLWEYSASSADNTMTKVELPLRTYWMNLDRTGDTLLFRGQVQSPGYSEVARIYSRDWTMRGTLPNTMAESILSPDGKRAYVYLWEDNAKIHVYDLTATPAGGDFPELTPITLPVPVTDSHTMKFAITPDGRTLFIAGDLALVAQALP
jgi:hypothetical protein